jgi:hypothetical protein
VFIFTVEVVGVFAYFFAISDVCKGFCFVESDAMFYQLNVQLLQVVGFLAWCL